MHGAGARPQHDHNCHLDHKTGATQGGDFCRAACSFLVRRHSSDKGSRFIGKLLFSRCYWFPARSKLGQMLPTAEQACLFVAALGMMEEWRH